MWTWISFCFTFFAFGGVLFIYEFWLNSPDEGPMDPLLASFRPHQSAQGPQCFTATGSVRLVGARFGGELNLSAARLAPATGQPRCSARGRCPYRITSRRTSVPDLQI